METPIRAKRCWGFVLHFGYVESGRAAPLVIHTISDGFASVEKGLRHLAHYLLDVYWEENHEIGISLDGFQNFLKNLPFSDASENQPFDSAHVNEEEWWPWDNLYGMYPYFDKVWENVDAPAEWILPRFLSVEKCPIVPAFREEVKQSLALEENKHLANIKKQFVSIKPQPIVRKRKRS